MEHPQPISLGKLLDPNKSSANAYENKAEQKAERTFIISRWMNLQQSVNVHFDSKNATGEFVSLLIQQDLHYSQIYYQVFPLWYAFCFTFP